VKVGVLCYPTPGGSGAVATELASRLAEVAEEEGLDVVHAHYAIPHALAALLVRDVVKDRRLPVVTTLHGTDITLVGSDPSFSEIVAYSIESSDGVTAVSHSLRESTRRELGVRRSIEVIPNCLDCAVYHRRSVPGLRKRFAPDEATKLVIHISNFRPVKRIDAVLDVFARISRAIPARLLLVGDGPELGAAYRLGRELGIAPLVETLGAQEDVIPLLSVADVFLLPSAQESFGLAALEAMACEVPVVASNVGGLPEVIGSGVSGFLRDPTDHQGMAADAVALLKDPDLHRRVTQAASARVREEFCVDRVVPMYERYYERVLGR
jgi:N-acetyl-alpha-D-glucosaminyl L-malate synthase BshA